MFQLVSVRHVGAHPNELQHGVSIQNSINLGKPFPRISRIRIIPSSQILARVFVYLPPFIFQILDLICRMVLIFILIYFEWRDTENHQLSLDIFFLALCGYFRCIRLSIVNYNNSIKIVYYYVGMLVLCSSSLFCHATLL